MQNRKSYRKPEILKVELRPEEAVLTACKSTSGGGPDALCTARTCKAQGS